MPCHYTAAGAGDTHEIPDGNRRLDLRFTVDWGDEDLRVSHTKPLTFCSFGCLSKWAAAKELDHDGHVLKEGE